MSAVACTSCGANVVGKIFVSIAEETFESSVIVVARLCGLEIELARPAVAATMNHVIQIIVFAVPGAGWNAAGLMLTTIWVEVNVPEVFCE